MMKVLFIGGTGLISTAVTNQAPKRGIDLYVLNRGNKNNKLPEGVTSIKCDIYDEKSVKTALKGYQFDSIVDWIAFTEEHVKRDYRLFKNMTKQYVFISSASAYQKPLPKLPITEDIALDNPYWQYSKNKQLCEEYLLYLNDDNFNVTIIRPSHTYDDHGLIFQVKSDKNPFTILKRMIDHKPVIIPDDGKSLWTLTYNYDFAEAFLDILGNDKTYHHYYHLTSDKVYDWNQLTQAVYNALNVKPNIIHIPTDFILKHFPELKGELYGDKKDSAVFDNSKIKEVAQHYISKTEYPNIVKKSVAYYLSNKNLQGIDVDFSKRYDALIDDYKKTLNT
jgi:nucleoside-diphosphate-sugar epimerase